MIDYEELEPHSDLVKPYVHLYSFAQGTLEEADAKYITRAFPTFLIQFYFEFAGNLAKIKTKESQKTIHKKGYVNTCNDIWLDIFQTASKANKRDVKNFKIDLYPHALFYIFGISPLEIETMSGDLREVWGKGYDALFGALEETDTALDAVGVFEKHLEVKIKESKRPMPFEAATFLRHQSSLKMLCADIGYSSRWVQKHHLQVFGISFKKAQGMMRFFKTIQHIALHVKHGNAPLNLTFVAYENGYFDQAHFIKEFKRYSGMTPSDYLTKKFNGQILFFW